MISLYLISTQHGPPVRTPTVSVRHQQNFSNSFRVNRSAVSWDGRRERERAVVPLRHRLTTVASWPMEKRRSTGRVSERSAIFGQLIFLKSNLIFCHKLINNKYYGEFFLCESRIHFSVILFLLTKQ